MRHLAGASIHASHDERVSCVASQTSPPATVRIAANAKPAEEEFIFLPLIDRCALAEPRPARPVCLLMPGGAGQPDTGASVRICPYEQNLELAGSKPIFNFRACRTGVRMMPAPPVQRVFVISEDPVVRRRLAHMLLTGGLAEPLLFESTQAFVDQYAPDWCGCVLFDLRISGYDGLRLRKHQQKAKCKMALVYFIVRNDVPVVVERTNDVHDLESLDVTDAGYDLIARVREALRRHEGYCARAEEQSRLRARYASTSKREREVLERLARGCTNKEIGVELGVSPRTVEIYRGRLQQKMQAETAADLVRLWMTIGAEAKQHT